MNPDMLGAVGGAKTIGRYFTVVSFLPSVPFVAYMILLQKSGAWGGPVHLGRALGRLDTTEAVVLGVGSLTLAIALHPLQFAFVQFFEGYWGSSRLAVSAATRCMERHRRRQCKLTAESWRIDETFRQKNLPSVISATRSTLTALVRAAESGRQATYYPTDLAMIMPTRLGNVLRRYELEAGQAYGLDCLTVLPRIMQRADQRDIDYVQNQRTQLDLAVRTAVLGLAAAAATLAYMLNHGAWLLLCLVPYALAFAAYRGAVRVAHEYGTSLAVLLDLNRFTLYEQLHLKTPDGLGSERDLNARLMPLLGLDQYARSAVHDSVPVSPPLMYQHPDPGPVAETGSGESG